MNLSLVFYPSENIFYTNNTQIRDYDDNEIITQIKYNNILLDETDIKRIKSGWLNDNVIDFFTKYFLDEIEEEQRKRMYIFGATFYEMLRTTKYKPTKTFFDVSRINTIIFPICTSAHFSLAIFHNLLTIYNDVRDECCNEDDCKILPAIICLDPLRLHSPHQIAKILRHFYTNILNKYIGEEHEILEIFPRLILPKMTLQENASDCGTYILSYFRYFIHHIPQIGKKEIDNNLVDWSSDYDQCENPLRMREEMMQIIHNINKTE